MFGLTHPCEVSVIIKCLGNILTIAITVTIITTLTITTAIPVMMIILTITIITKYSSINMFVMLHTMHS